MLFWNAFNTRTKIALARRLARVITAARALRGASESVVVTRHGVRFELDLNEGIDFCIYLLGTFEPDTYRTLRRLVRPGATVLDIGANIGAHTLHLAQAVGGTGRVIAFKPTDYAYRKLCRNLELNPSLARRVVAVRAYLTDRQGMQQAPSFYASWRLDRRPGQHPKHLGSLASAVEARECTLDGYLAAHGVRAVEVIKLDVDGFECKMLRGGRSTLEDHRPAIVTELCPYALEEHGDSATLLLSLLRTQGYRFYDGTSLAPFAGDDDDILRGIPRDGSINVVALAGRTATRR